MRRVIVYILVLVILFALVRTYFAEHAAAPSVPSLQGSSASSTQSHAGSSASCVTATLVFYSKTDFEKAEFAHPVSVQRCIPKTTNIAFVVLKQLFAGPTADEKKKGALGSADLQTIGLSYLGVSVDKGIATVNFKKDALTILNSAAVRQMMAKAPIEATLKSIEGITVVKYAINGKVFDQWNA